jgi:hypothetical protein
MLLQNRHDDAIESEIVMGRPCPITRFPPKEPEEAPRSPPSQGLLLCEIALKHSSVDLSVPPTHLGGDPAEFRRQLCSWTEQSQLAEVNAQRGAVSITMRPGRGRGIRLGLLPSFPPYATQAMRVVHSPKPL